MNHVTTTLSRPQLDCSDATVAKISVGSDDWRSFHLCKGALQTQRLAAKEIVEIQILAGAAWVTLEGDANDYVLTAGDTRILRGPGLVVVEGLMESNSGEQLRSRE